MVYLCLPVLDPLFVDHTNQVSLSSLGRIFWLLFFFFFLCLVVGEADIRSLRVNLDMGKTVYAHQIQTDQEIPNTIVRTSTLPEELGRVEYLLSDKTGTLTRNGASSPDFIGQELR